jgi:hypothetical protein
MLNCPLTETLSPLAVAPPAFEIVTVWAALDCPTAVGAKVNVAGLALSAEADKPVPLSGTTAATTPGVDEVSVSAAAAVPALSGLKMICTVQLD